MPGKILIAATLACCVVHGAASATPATTAGVTGAVDLEPLFLQAPIAFDAPGALSLDLLSGSKRKKIRAWYEIRNRFSILYARADHGGTRTKSTDPERG